MESLNEENGTSKLKDFKVLEVGPVSTNCYIFSNYHDEAAIVDPGDNARMLLETIDSFNCSLKLILCTHGHFDHISAAGEIKDQTGAKIFLHGDDLPLWEKIGIQAQMFGLQEPPLLPAPDTILSGEEVLSLGDIKIKVHHTPGHSPGSVIFSLVSEDIVMNGDTVFSMGIGRTDLWGGNSKALKDSLKNKIFSMPDDVILYPGHGPSTTVAGAHKNLMFLDF